MDHTANNISCFLFVTTLLCCYITASSLEIRAFQPAVVPIRAVTTLTLQTDGDLNVTSKASLQCRFKDISMPATLKDEFIFCDTPPVRNIEKVSLQLDVDGKLFKTKKPLYFYEPFKVSNITPSVVSPAQNIHLTVSGISCQDWMQYFVRFQTANGAKKTQQGICKDSVVTCSVPEFPPNTRLRVGVTLSNRLVEWADEKILIQYPIDALRSFVKDVETDTSRKGAFNFRVELSDRFGNSISIKKRQTSKRPRVSVQYSASDESNSMKFLNCLTSLQNTNVGSSYFLSCEGAEKEDIIFYPSINNVPLGGQAKYEAKTTLCPGKLSCKDSGSFPLVLVAALSGGGAFAILLIVFLLFVVGYRRRKYHVTKKRREAQRLGNELEMEVQPSEDVGFSVEQTRDELVHEQVNSALETEEYDVNTTVDENLGRDVQTGETDGVQTESEKALQEGDTETPTEKTNEEGISIETKRNILMPQTDSFEMSELKEETSIALLLKKLEFTTNSFLSVLTQKEGEDNKQGSPDKQTDSLKKMHGILQEIEPLCKHAETITAVNKAKETCRLLRLSFQEMETTDGNVNTLPLTEELQEELADLQKALAKDRTRPRHDETEF